MSKEATVFVVDLAQNMGQLREGRDQTDIEIARRYIEDRILDKVISKRKTDMVGIVGVRCHRETPGTEPMGSGVVKFRKIQQFQLEDIKEFDKWTKNLSENSTGDIYRGILSGIDMIKYHCKKLKYIKTLVLVTNAIGDFRANNDEIKQLAADLLQSQITVQVIVPDLCIKLLPGDWVPYLDEHSNPEIDETKMQDLSNVMELQELEDLSKNSVLLTVLSKQSYQENAWIISGDAVLSSMSLPSIKRIKPTHTYRGDLTLGNSDIYGTDRTISIGVVVYPLVRKVTTMSAKLCYVTPETKEVQKVSREPDYYFYYQDEEVRYRERGIGYESDNEENEEDDDEDDDSKKVFVEKDECEAAYLYGQELVTFSQEEEQMLGGVAYPSCFEIIAFTPLRMVPRWILMTRTDVVLPSNEGKDSSFKLGALAKALKEMNAVCIARYVPKEKQDLQIVCISPAKLQNHSLVLTICALPFNEDIRKYQFDNFVNETGKINNSTNLSKAQGIMDDLVLHMNLSTIDDEEGEEEAYANPEEIYAPAPNRIIQVVKHRALHDDTAIPPPLPVLTEYQHLSPEFLKPWYKQRMSQLVDLFDIKPADETKKRKAQMAQLAEEEARRKTLATKTDLDIDSLLNE